MKNIKNITLITLAFILLILLSTQIYTISKQGKLNEQNISLQTQLISQQKEHSKLDDNMTSLNSQLELVKDKNEELRNQ